MKDYATCMSSKKEQKASRSMVHRGSALVFKGQLVSLVIDEYLLDV